MAVERARELIYVHNNGKESGKEREDMDLCLNLLEEEAQAAAVAAAAAAAAVA
jgi:hypothetical protein